MKEVALSDLINQQKVGRYQKFILITCLLLMIMDGYDIQSMAYAAPMIIEEWGVQKSMLELCLAPAYLVCLSDHFIKFIL